MKAYYIHVKLMKLTSRWRAKYKWYDITAHFVIQIRSLTEIFFFVFNLFQIVSACRFRNACARLIFIKLFINRINLYSFFFSFFLLYKLICVNTKVTSFVYYEDGFPRVLRNIHSLTIYWQRKFYWNLISAFCI